MDSFMDSHQDVPAKTACYYTTTRFLFVTDNDQLKKFSQGVSETLIVTDNNQLTKKFPEGFQHFLPLLIMIRSMNMYDMRIVRIGQKLSESFEPLSCANIKYRSFMLLRQ